MSRRVLVVDDDDLTREILATMLDLEEYEVSLAEDGASALAAIADQAPDLIVLDVMMPGMSGFEVCATLKGDPATAAVPSVLLTARDSDDDRRAGAEAGADAYLTKPFSPLALIDTIRDFVTSPPGPGVHGADPRADGSGSALEAPMPPRPTAEEPT